MINASAVNVKNWTFKAVVENLESRGVMPDRPPSLSVTSEGLKRIGFFETPFYKRLLIDPLRVVVVAGTNGKGSVSATLEALLIDAGESTGLYTSPHLMNITERIRVCRTDIPTVDFIDSFVEVERLTQELKLTHFEMLTLMSVWYFCQKNVDRMILEVGMGGTWDSTNAVPHGMSVITSIGLDHTQLLGKTRPEIALQKLGIVPEQNSLGSTLVVHMPVDSEIAPVWNEYKNRVQSASWREREPYSMVVRDESQDPQFRIKTKWGEETIQLPGERGAMNTSLALTVFSELGYDPQKHLSSLAYVRWPGRMERLNYLDRRIYFSGDHNVQGVSSLLSLLPYYKRSHLHVLLGVGRDKDLPGILDPLFLLPDTSVYLTETPFKGRKIDEYGPYLNRATGFWNDPIEALEEICANSESTDMILVTGSLYLVGDLLKYVKGLA